MIHQYDAPRHRPTTMRGRRVNLGTVPVGTILYIQDRGRCVCRDPWIVEAWLNREYHRAGRPSVFIRGGHLAVVRSLRTGRRCVVADHYLLAAQDAGLEIQ